MNVSLIIPAHNEQGRLAPTLRLYGAALRQRYGDDFEILVMANGCTDATVREALELAEEYPQITVVDIPAPIGKGGAILKGFRHARGQRIAFADADGATAPDSLLALIDALDFHDVVIGSRYMPQSQVPTRQSALRRALSTIFAAFVRVLFGLRYYDTQCGAKAFRRSAALALARVVEETRWVFDVDLLLSAEALDLNVAELPVVWADQAGSSVQVLPTSQQVLRSFWSLWRGRRERELRGAQVRAAALGRAAAVGRKVVTSGALPRLRILALNWRGPGHPQYGGSEVNLFEQARLWVQAGHQVTVVCADPGREYTPARDDMVDGITVRRMGGTLTVYLFAAWFLLRHGHEYDCVLDIANGVPFFAPLFCRTPVTLLVHHVHDRQWFAEFPYPVAAVGRAIERELVPRVYHDRPVIAVSPTTRAALIELGFGPSQIHIVYNGVSSHPAPRPLAQPDRHRIAYVGRIKHYKRLDRLVRAVAELREQFPDVQLDIAGDGDARADLAELIDRLGLQDCVSLYGPVDEEQKAAILGAAAVFATASMHEGWGISVLEANAYGCPAVAYDVPGLRVAIRDGTTGLLAGDDADFERALALIMQDQGLRDRLSSAARRWAAGFDWRQSAQATLELLYSGAIASPAQIPSEQSLLAGAERRDDEQYAGEPLLEREVGA